MVQLVKNIFRRTKSILGVTALSTTAANIACNGSDITFYCVSGNIWVNTTATAVADTTAIKLTEGELIELNVAGNLSIISDVTGATYQYIIWDL